MAAVSPSRDTVFCAAIEIASAEERAAYIARECGDDEALRAQVHKLVEAHFRAGNFLEEPAHDLRATGADEAAPEANGTEQPGVVLGGRYKLLEQIGEGGMGTVWMAQQTTPVKRLVAVKLIKTGMDSKAVLARLEAEGQAVALMDHPNIAKVHDAGTTKGEPGGVSPGRPFFVMELIKGVPITQYCDEQRLSLRQRLELMVPVCQAVQHAHHKGIIHRDIKPSNVLVACYDDRPVPKVIDFGVAKATGQQLTEQTLQTGFGTVVGTVKYMSPEQASFNQLDVDTRSDIYSLGVLLYELLTGTTPLDRKRLKERTFLEVLRLIREEEPPRPSTRLSTTETLPNIAANRGTEPKRLTALVKGELDWIVMKALEKDRDRRYESANGLARDIERYLHDEPVQACPASALYRFRKFARRNKTGLAIAGLVLFFSVLLGGGVGWMVRDRAAQQALLEREVTRALEEAETVYKRDKLPEALAAVKRAEVLLASGGGSEELRQRVRQWRADLDLVARLQEATMQATQLDAEGHISEKLVIPEYEEAFRAYGIDRASMPPEQAAQRIGDRPQEIQLALIAALDHWIDLESRFGKRPRDDPQQQAWLKALVLAVDTDPWRARMRQAVERQDFEALAELVDSPEMVKQAPYTLNRLGVLLDGRANKPALAIVLLRRAQQLYPGDFWLNDSLGSVLHYATPPQPEEAVRFYSSALALQPANAAARLNLGVALKDAGRLEEAITATHRAIELRPDYALAHMCLGDALRNQGTLDEAIGEFRKALALKSNHADAQCNLGQALRDKGEFAAALIHLKRGHELGSRDPRWTYPSAQWIKDCERLIELDARLSDVLAGKQAVADAKERLAFAEVCYRKRRFEQATRFYEETLARESRLAEDPKADHRYNAACAAALAGIGEGQEASALGDEQRARRRRQALDWLGADLQQRGRELESAAPTARAALVRTLRHRLRDPDLKGVRDNDHVDKLPPDEREACGKLWSNVRVLLSRAESDK